MAERTHLATMITPAFIGTPPDVPVLLLDAVPLDADGETAGEQARYALTILDAQRLVGQIVLGLALARATIPKM